VLRTRLAEALRLAGCAYGRAGEPRRRRAPAKILPPGPRMPPQRLRELGYDVPNGAAQLAQLPGFGRMSN
jgi:hypothetical protein